MAAIARQNGFYRAKAAGWPQADHRLVSHIGGGGGQIGEQCAAQPRTVHRAAKHRVKALQRRVAKRGGKPGQWPHAGGGPIGQGLDRSGIAPRHHHRAALAGEHGDGMFKQRTAIEQRQRLVAAKAAGLATGEDRAKDHGDVPVSLAAFDRLRLSGVGDSQSPLMPSLPQHIPRITRNPRASA